MIVSRNKLMCYQFCLLFMVCVNANANINIITVTVVIHRED